MQSNSIRRSPFAVALVLSLFSAFSHASVSTPGEFRVNEMGAATYTIPLQVPPGVAGMEPKLALTYNSQAGNGLAGVGWSLAGLSSITRCPRTQAQDGARGTVNFDGNDRYCLDGQRLMLVSGTYGADGSEYRTELETFSKVVAHGAAGNGPAWFEVWNKDGRRVEYGNTTDSRIEAQGKTTVAVWAMNRLEDRKGNYLTAGYIEDNANGQFYPSRMDWGGNSKAGTPYTSRVAFDYETRPDIVPYYQAGSLFSLRVRLTTVRAVEADNLVRSYNLSYLAQSGVKRSRLASVTECEAGGNCLAPVQLSWAASDVLNFYAGQNNSINTTGVAAGDYFGDGKAYLVPQVSPPTPVASTTSESWSVYSFSSSGAMNTMASGFGKSPFAMDSDGTGTEKVADAQAIATSAAVYSSYSSLLAWSAADIYGDGKTGVLAYYASPGARDSTNYALHALSVSNNTVTKNIASRAPSDGYAKTGDFNGDGYLDVLTRPNGVVINWGSSSGTWDGTNSTSLSYSGDLLVGDFNGDGKSDLIMLLGGPQLWLSKGNGTFDVKIIPITGGDSGDSNALHFVVADFNGDGRSDVLHATGNGTSYLWLSNGNEAFNIFKTAFSGPASAAIVGDFQGDGRTDIYENDGYRRVWFTGPSNISDTVIQIQTGSGLTITPSYSSLAYRGCNRASGQSYPTVASCAPLYVVDQVAYSGMAASSHTVKYNYGGLTKRVDGRGLLGFAWMDATDVEHDNQRTRTVFNQTWPLTGTVASVTRYGNSVGNAGKLAETIQSYTSVSLGNGRSFVGNTQTVSNSWDLNGTALPSSTVTRSYDCQSSTTCYGNLLTETSSSSDSYAKTVTSSYSNDSTSWLIGRVTQQTVSATTP